MPTPDPTPKPEPDASASASEIEALREQIREQGKLELSLRESEASYRAIIDHQEDLICRYRAEDYSLIFANVAFCRFYHRTPEELLGQSFLDILHPEEREARQLLIDRLAEKKEMFTYEHRSTDAEGLIYWHKWTDIPLCEFREGEVDVIIQSSATNITPQKVNEQVLRRSATLFWALTELASNPELSLESKIRQILDMCRTFFGMEIGILSQVVGHQYTVREISTEDQAIKPGDVFDIRNTYGEETLRSLKPVSLARTSSHREERHPAFADQQLQSYIGAQVLIESQAYGTLDFSSFTPRATPFTETERTFISLAAQWIGYELGRVANHDVLLKQSEELERSNTELEHFAYIVSHDLQEPLRTVKSFAELLATSYQDQLDEEAGTMLRFILEGSDRMSRLVHDLLAYSRVTSNPNPFADTDMDDIVQEVISSLQAAIDTAHAEVQVEPLPRIHADPSQMSRLMQNLIGNAVKFHGDRPPRIRVSGSTLEPGAWRFSVEDNGIGIAPEHRERIFKVFQRLHGREDYDGTGIGLAVCRRVVERHGGEIHVEPTKGSGATFVFTIRTGETPANPTDPT